MDKEELIYENFEIVINWTWIINLIKKCIRRLNEISKVIFYKEEIFIELFSTN